MRVAAFVLALLAAAPVAAEGAYQLPEDEGAANFVANEVIATFYHELGHALIDVLALPVLGREEDAADGLSVVLMNDIWEEDSAAEILKSDAMSYELMAKEQEAGGLDAYFADVHSLSIQRYYNVVCLFYGANPEAREGLAKELDLPEDRREGCPAEFDQVAASWDAMLQDEEGSAGLVMAPETDGLPLADILADEVATLNERIALPVEVVVKVEDCGEANAFYDPEARSITMCNEYAEYLEELYANR